MSKLFLVAMLFFVACESSPQEIVVKPVPEGFELTTTGSGCRETATGQYVDQEKCMP